MNSKDIIIYILSHSNKTAIGVSRDMGRSDSYIRQTISRGSSPTLPVFCEIARACGYKLKLVSDTDDIDITDTIS